MNKIKGDFYLRKIKTALFTTAILGTIFSSQTALAQESGWSNLSKTVYDETTKTFDVIGVESQNGKKIDHMDVAIWSEENGQDDIKWYSTSNIQSGQANIQFNLANHNNAAGNYIIHVYTTYTDGQKEGRALENTLIAPKGPQVSLANNGIKMETPLKPPTGGQFLTAIWSEENGQDDIKWYDTSSSITYADLNNHKGSGTYHLHTYLSQNGNMSIVSMQSITVERKQSQYQVSRSSDTSYDIIVNNIPDSITSVSIPVWSDVNGQDDIKWYSATKIGHGSYKVTVPLTNHGFDYGTYSAHVYGQNSQTNKFEGLMVTDGFTVDHIDSLTNPNVSLQNTGNGIFNVSVTETAMSKKVVGLSVTVTSQIDGNRTKTISVGTQRWGYAIANVDLKSLSAQTDNYRVLATVNYSDGSSANFNMTNQSYNSQATSSSQTAASPRITAYINEVNTYPAGQCTWGVKSLAPWVPNYLGHASGWATNMAAKGFRTGSTPEVGAVAVWPYDGGGYGHVAYVTAVESDTRIQVKESNYAGNQYIKNFRGWFNPRASTWGGTVIYVYPN